MVATEPALVEVPAGTLVAGVPECPPDAALERRWHTGKRVDVAAFRIGKYPVTNREYRRYIAETGADVPMRLDFDGFEDDAQPVVGISWDDATGYAGWLTENTGTRYRLPGDAEFEYAARGSREGSKFPWGDDLDPAHTSYGGMTAPPNVGSYPANGFGVCDMVGGVWEWCQDRYEDVSDGVPATNNPTGGNPSENPVLRGGSYFTNDPLNLYIAYRHEDPADLRHEVIGFRLAV
jgi:formylglycine-generating enzyme required for sulfatase activity